MSQEQLSKLEQVSHLFEEMAEICGQFVAQMVIAEKMVESHT